MIKFWLIMIKHFQLQQNRKTIIKVFLFCLFIKNKVHNKLGDFMKNISVWLNDIKRINYPAIETSTECDILIIGGGITGISCGYFLKNSKEKIILVEANQLCEVTTAHSTGKLTYLQDDNLNKIRKAYNRETAIKYLDSQIEAINLAKSIIKKHRIDCDFNEVDSYLFTSKKNNIKKLNDIYNLLIDYIDINVSKNLPIDNISCIKSLWVKNTYVFHPTKFVLQLAHIISPYIDIYEKTRIINLKFKNNLWHATTNKNINIKAKKIILACHYPFFLIPFFFPFKTTLEKSFLTSSYINDTKNITAINIDKKILSFRYYQNNQFIMLSETNDIGKSINNLKEKEKMLRFMKNNFSLYPTYCWSNHDIITIDYLPLIGKIDNNLFLATGYNTWGMTNGILAGKIISDLILKRNNQYSKLFNPLRKTVNITNFLQNNIKNGISFINSKTNKNKNFYQENVKIIKENGVWYGIYIDDNNQIHKVLNKCPHMKCNLSFNYQNKTWDCPCHGSQFDIDGNIIFGPANHNIKI